MDEDFLAVGETNRRFEMTKAMSVSSWKFMPKLQIPNVDLSIIIPAYRAGNFIARDITNLERILEKNGKTFEIICIVDGFVDNTYEEAWSVQKEYPKVVRVYGYKKNKGKGYATRFGMKKAKGRLIGFIDTGGEIDPKSILSLMRIQEESDADIVVGSKRHPDSKVAYPLIRRLMSYIYYLVIKTLYHSGVTDTQAGIKLFTKEVIKKVLPHLKIDGFAFDIEFLVTAKRLGYRQVYEAPIKVEMKSKNLSTIGLKPIFRMFVDTFLLFDSSRKPRNSLRG